MTATAPPARNRSWVVVDNAAWAWRNVADNIKDEFYARLDEDFVFDNRAQLDAAATTLFGPALVTQWWKRGFPVMFGPDNDATMLRRPKDLPHHEVWDAAASGLDPYLVVIKAGLDDELLRYAAAHPRAEHLDRHSAALRQHTDQLRVELHERLDQLAARSPRAEQQLDGWRAAVDTAWTRAQLEHLATEIPA
jgi:hypothetical protein